MNKEVSKKCKSCNETKPLSDFGVHTFRTQRPDCKVCEKKARNKKYYERIKGEEWRDRYAEKQKEAYRTKVQAEKETRKKLLKLEREQIKAIHDATENPECNECGCSCFTFGENDKYGGCSTCGCKCE